MSDEQFISLYTQSIEKQISNLDGYHIYADESMNLRKVRISNNIKDELKYRFFVLGGLIVPDGVNVEEFKELLDYRDNLPEEFKFKFFSHNNSDFKRTLKSQRLQKYFQFLLDNGIYIHLHVVNYWYWGLVDIIDSLVDFDNMFKNRTYKTALYEGLMSNYDEMFDLLVKYEYPSIPIGKEQQFIKEIICLLKKSKEETFRNGDDVFDSLCDIIDILDNKIIDELVLLKEEQPYEIASTMTNFYIQTAAVFRKNGIVFDNEKKVIDEINKISPTLCETLKCQFIDSKDNFSIQLSDVIAGFTARLFEFLVNENNVENLLDSIKTGSIEMQNITLFSEILYKSIEFYNLSYCKTISIHQEQSIYKFFDIMKYFI